MAASNTYKIALIGTGDVGKTSLVIRHTTGLFRKEYNSEQEIVTVIPFNTNMGMQHTKITELGDHSSTESYDGIIYMFDLTRSKTFDYIKIRVLNGPSKIPSVLVGNKTDMRDREVLWADVESFMVEQKVAIKYYDYSSKSNYNFEKPFLYLLKQLINPNLELIDFPALPPPELRYELQ